MAGGTYPSGTVSRHDFTEDRWRGEGQWFSVLSLCLPVKHSLILLTLYTCSMETGEAPRYSYTSGQPRGCARAHRKPERDHIEGTTWKVKWSRSVTSDSLRPHRPAYQAPPSMGFSSNSTGVDCHFLLQGIVPTQGSNPGLPHCRQTVYRLSHQGSWSRSKIFSPKKKNKNRNKERNGNYVVWWRC